MSINMIAMGIYCLLLTGVWGFTMWLLMVSKASNEDHIRRHKGLCITSSRLSEDLGDLLGENADLRRQNGILQTLCNRSDTILRDAIDRANCSAGGVWEEDQRIEAEAEAGERRCEAEVEELEHSIAREADAGELAEGDWT